ncbi:MAG: hypothetical protein HOP31_00520 [Ignavibacteria bacterium]|nr:hypothetical protein [Ignavibacteria bacterium]
MKPHISIFTRSFLLVLFILPYVFFSSCGDSGAPVGFVQHNAVTGDIPIASQQGLLRLTINYKSGNVIDEYCWLVQAGLSELALVRRIASPELKVISIQQVSSLTLTKWTRETFWGRVITGTHLTDSMCCTSVRYDGEKWYLESPGDTIQAVINPGRIVNFFEKCPY